MRVQKGSTYAINKSDIVVKILEVISEDENTQTVETAIYHKRTLDLLEGPRYYELDCDKTKYWKRV